LPWRLPFASHAKHYQVAHGAGGHVAALIWPALIWPASVWFARHRGGLSSLFTRHEPLQQLFQPTQSALLSSLALRGAELHHVSARRARSWGRTWRDLTLTVRPPAERRRAHPSMQPCPELTIVSGWQSCLFREVLLVAHVHW